MIDRTEVKQIALGVGLGIVGAMYAARAIGFVLDIALFFIQIGLAKLGVVMQ